MNKKATSQNFLEIQPIPAIPKPTITDRDKGQWIFLNYARFLGFTDERALKLLQGQKAYKSVDDFLEALANHAINAELELDAVLRTL